MILPEPDPTHRSRAIRTRRNCVDLVCGSDHDQAMYELRFTSDAADFLSAAADHLAQRPVLSTVVATIADRAVREDAEGIERDPDRPWWFVTVEDHDHRLVGEAMRTGPGPHHAVWVQDLPEEAAVQLARALHERGEFTSAVNGTIPAARLMADEVARLWGEASAIRTHTRLYQLGALATPTGVPGRLRRAGTDDLELMNHWLSIFDTEAAKQGGRPMPTRTDEHDRQETARRIQDGRLWIWEDQGRPVHVTGINLPSFGVGRIGPVLTPAEHRGHGYASAAVAGVSQHLLDLGVQACLFTDQANPVSNKVYQRIGYRPVADMAEFSISRHEVG
jgi:RimJ/RimL family protein N-acetyltransferase